MTIEIHAMPMSAPCRIAIMTAEKLAIDYKYVLVNLNEGDHLKPEFLKVKLGQPQLNLYGNHYCQSQQIRGLFFGGTLLISEKSGFSTIFTSDFFFFLLFLTS